MPTPLTLVDRPFVPTVAFMLFACTDIANHPPDSQSEADASVRSDAELAQTDTPEAGSALDGIRLCDGSSKVRLAFEGDRGDCPPDLFCPGSAVMSELGASYLVLDGQCNLYFRHPTQAGTRVKKLGEQDLADLVAVLRVAEWPPAGTYCDNAHAFDLVGLGVRYYLAGRVIAVQHCIDGKPPVMGSLAYQYVIAHFDEGEQLAGPLRYTLVPTQVPEHYSFAFAQPFPDIARNVVDPGVSQPQGVTGPILLADGEAAAQLRARRDAWLKVAGPQQGDFVPSIDVQAGDGDAGVRMELRMRDVLPLEQTSGPKNLF